MANRKRSIDEKVRSVEVALDHINVEAAARDADVPASTLRYDLNKVKRALPEVLANHKPGPKPCSQPTEPSPAAVPDDGPKVCPQCGGKVTKNGGYWVLNWLLMLTVGWLGVQWVRIQRRRCTVCGAELISPERARQACLRRQAEARRAWWAQVNRLIGLSRFKLGLSVRKIQTLVQFVYARRVSSGHIERLTLRVGQWAEKALARLRECRQAQALFLLYDETYPKMKKRTYSLGVAICEHGLIRSVRCINTVRIKIGHSAL